MGEIWISGCHNHWKPGPVKLPAYTLQVGLRVSGEHQHAQVDAVIADFFRCLRPGLEAHPPRADIIK